MSTRLNAPLVDVVDTAEDAARLEHPPLLVRQSMLARLDAHGLGSGEPRIARIGAGHSNVTFLIERDGWVGILRRPPRPPYQDKAHDVLREAVVQQALRDTVLPVPQIQLVVEHDPVLQVPYYLMTRVHGDVVTDTVPARFDSPSGRHALGMRLADTLADLHGLDHVELGLGQLGRPDGFAERQLATFGRLWRTHRTRDIPAVDEAERWLRRHVPASAGARSIVHGDYRLANVMFAPGPQARVAALLDWELATVGDPESDLGYLLSTYPERADETGPLFSEAAVVASGDGFPSRDALVERYVRRTGRDPRALSWWVVLAFWRTAVGLESYYRRGVAGTTDDPFIHKLKTGVPLLGEYAVQAIGGW